VTSRVGEKENRTISVENSLQAPVEEEPGEPEPVLQRVKRINEKDHYLYQKGPAEIRYYARWVDMPYSNVPRVFEWAVAIPRAYNEKTPACLQISLHAWGGNVDRGTYWYDVKPCTIRASTVNYPVQDWWYGYRRCYGIPNCVMKDVVFNYTERRLMSFVRWLGKNWSIDRNLVFVEGQSMGGSGALHFGMKNGETFCYANAWVGIACWRYSTYFRNGEKKKWGATDELMNYNGVKFDDWMDLSWWLRRYPQKETPFLSFANGKNDGGIGWPQAVMAVKALWETKRPFVFSWGMAGHGQRAKFMLNPELIELKKSIPAFRNCSLDDDLGTGRKLASAKRFKTRSGKVIEDWYDGDSTGQINAYLLWKNITDQKDRYEITVYLARKAPSDSCVVDLTPRRTQEFRARPGEKFRWTNVSVADNSKIQSGNMSADRLGLVTIEGVLVTTDGNKISITAVR